MTHRAVGLVVTLVLGLAPLGVPSVAHAESPLAATDREARLAAVGTDPCASSPRAAFRDIGDDTAATGAIDCLVWHDLVRGVTYDRFRGSASLTRGQVATLIDRMVTELLGQLPDPATPRFDDVHGVHAPAIERLAAVGIITGRTATRYEPAVAVRRDQLASLLMRTHDHLANTDAADHPDDTGSAAVLDGFTDIGGNVHGSRITEAARLGLVTGTTTSTYEPARTASRGQTSMVLARLLRLAVADPAIGAVVAPPDGYASRIGPLPSSLLAEVERWTWEPGCPVDPSDLRSIELVHTDLVGTERWGRLVVHRSVATDVANALGEAHDRRFRIARIEPIEHFRGDDDASMAANNTSGFNCRRVTGGTSFSEHSYGRAIDINPVQNPYVRGSTVLPPAGRSYLDRSNVRTGMLVRPGGVTAFDQIGWGWGGDYKTLKDYQHLSSTGR